MAGRHERLAELLGLLRRPGEPEHSLTGRDNVRVGLGLLLALALVVTGVLIAKPVGWIVEGIGFVVLIGLNVAIQRVRRARTKPPPD